MPSEESAATGDQSAEELRRELAEAREQQAATAEILAAISSSPTDPRGALERIAASAARLCEAYDATIHQVDGGFLRIVAHNGPLPVAGRHMPLTRGRLFARAVSDRRTIHIADLQAETDEYPEGSDIARRLGYHTILVVPLIRAGEAIGTIGIRRTEVRPFSDKQIALLETFAKQAVIAIENTRLFEAEQASKRELQESLEYQTATSEVLNVISRSPTDVHPVFDTIARSSLHLCAGTFSTVFRFDGHLIHFAAAHGMTPEAVEAMHRTYPLPPGLAGATTRAIETGALVEIPDVYADPDFEHRHVSGLQNSKSLASVPMLKDGRPIGAITVGQAKTGRFPPRQIELLKTFADQAVIAIENTRLFEAEQASKRELQESLEYQTATSEVLGVISRSPSDLRPVLETIVDIAARLCEAEYAHVRLLQDGLYRFVASTRRDAEYLRIQLDNPTRPGRDSMTGRAALERRTVHVSDAQQDTELTFAKRTGLSARAGLAVPLMRQGEAIGVIALFRDEPRPYTPKQIALVETFANQAVIAIENTRLFEEVQARTRDLTEALEQQTATADVLKVISRSALDVQKVLDALVESAARLCDAYDAAIFQVFGDGLRLVARYGQIPTGGPVGQLMRPLMRGLVMGRAVIDRRTIHVADVTEADEYPESRKTALQQGFRTALAVPLVHAGEAIGVIGIRRAEVRPFSERQIELVNTFADQAVIAIENTRLFEEVQTRTRELAKTVEDLEIASQHKNQFVANMSHELRTPLAAILGYAELIQEGFYEPQGPKSLDALTRIRSNGKHLLGLINTVLDIAKIESGQFTLNMTEYAIESVVETVRAATESLAQNKKLSLKTEVAKPLPIGLGDEQRLTQVLLNLVGNAIKFTDTGEVRVTAKAVNGHFNVSVTDTGPGIPEHERARIFEQFHQVDSSLTKAKGGTGLGLAIAKQIVEMHGGRIWVESTPGKGSTFQMKLPTRAEFRKTAP